MNESSIDAECPELWQSISDRKEERAKLLDEQLEKSPIYWRETLAVLLLVILSDITLYYGQGFAGLGAFFVAAPICFLLGTRKFVFQRSFLLVVICLFLIAARAVWLGSELLAYCGFAFLIAYCMSLSKRTPAILESASFVLNALKSGVERLNLYQFAIRKLNISIFRVRWLNFLLPVIVLSVFSLIFTMANPDLVTFFGENFQIYFQKFREYILGFMPEAAEPFFWAFVVVISLGMLNPLFKEPDPKSILDNKTISIEDRFHSHLYPAFRNTLLTVILLFSVYLIFEFGTLWFREFPKGFYYAVYAHEGAAWLTLALALATLLLSVMFRGDILYELRLSRLKQLAWVWSIQNLILALAVFNRLFIYIGFNGMTRMRVIGLLGTTAVVLGLILVIRKISKNKNFLWLIRHQLWALGLIITLFALLPVDYLVNRYNAHRILVDKQLAPSVQITVHPINSEGIMALLPLVESENEIIREGVQAILAKREFLLRQSINRKNQSEHWTSYQLALRYELNLLEANHSKWSEFSTWNKKRKAIERFEKYAFQWY